MNDRNEFHLAGLRGDNPMAVLAALGALRTSASAFGRDAVHMRWHSESDVWRPVLGIAGVDAMDETSFVNELHQRLQQGSGRQAFGIGDDLTLSPQAFRTVSQQAAIGSHADEREFVDFIAAFGCDGVELVENGKASGKMADTAFRTMSGAGHQHFLGFMRTLADDCKPEHLQRSLFAEWRYDDPLESHTMRWDPTDDVRYALRWRDSSGDPDRKRTGAMWGANRLAVEGLPMLPTVPVLHGQLATVGFTNTRETGAAWTWPIWDGWCSVDIVKSMLSLRSLQMTKPSRPDLEPLGVMEIFRCYRIRQGKYRNLTPGQPV